MNFGPTFKRVWMWVVAVCLLAAGLYFFFIRGDKAQSLAAKQKQDSAARGVPVVAAPAKTGDIHIYRARFRHSCQYRHGEESG